MKIAIIYASTEGQTRKIAHHAEELLQGEDHSVTLRHASDAGDLRLSQFDAIILAASVHAATYQSELVAYAKEHASTLNEGASRFLSVSLAAAGGDDAEWTALRGYVEDLKTDTGWPPRQDRTGRWRVQIHGIRLLSLLGDAVDGVQKRPVRPRRRGSRIYRLGRTLAGLDARSNCCQLGRQTTRWEGGAHETLDDQ